MDVFAESSENAHGCEDGKKRWDDHSEKDEVDWEKEEEEEEMGKKSEDDYDEEKKGKAYEQLHDGGGDYNMGTARGRSPTRSQGTSGPH